MVRFAGRVNRVNPSAVREIFKLMADPDIISFGGGSPAVESFEPAVIREITDELLTLRPDAMLQYGTTEGWIPVREAYIEHIARPKGLEFSLDDVVVTTGSTQGISLSIDAFVNEGDTVLVESPTFLATLMMFNKVGARVVPVETDEDGMRTDDLKAKLESTGARFIYTIPTFQNPTGRTLSLSRRREVARLAAAYDAVVAEDDPYCDLRYSGEPLPSIKNFDEVGNVILLNSFSKTISPGLRVGTVAASPEIIKKLVVAKQCSDTHTAILPQAICAEYLSRGLLPSHLTQVAPMYKERLDTMLACIEKELPEGTDYTRPEGGLFIWLTLPGEPDMNELLRVATQEYKVAFVPGAPFFVDPSEGRNAFRLNFSGETPERIEEGMRRLGKAFGDCVR
ncbi:MAG: PLP-dependent aminotransferase family protein [Clostridiales Family XIII bacterium]|jgi:2-aminoadipate transaminase|nr:PLP-dependent aminotransferase family protein [Clostridiales Family XIII bacterium]